MSKSIFISYSLEDREKVKRIRKDIELDGHKIWIYPHAIEPGDHIVRSEEQGIKDADFVIVMLSQNSINSKAVKKEIKLTLGVEANSGKRKLIYVRIDQMVGLRNKEAIQMADLSADDVYPIELHRMLKKIANHKNFAIHPLVSRYKSHPGWFKVKLVLKGNPHFVKEVDYHLHPDIILDQNTIDNSANLRSSFSIQFDTDSPEYIYAVVHLIDGTVEEIHDYLHLI